MSRSELLPAPARAHDAIVPRAVLQAVAAVSAEAVIVAVERDGALVPIWANPAVDHLVGGPPGGVLAGEFHGLGLAPADIKAPDSARSVLQTSWMQGATADVELQRF